LPIFEYRCGACDREFEQLVRSSAETVACPDCASDRVTKLFSAASTPRGASASCPVMGDAAPRGGCCAGGGCGCSN